VSPFKEAAIVTLDGVGEWTTTAYGYGKDNHIKMLNEVRFPHSIGLLYSTVTAHLGFSVNNSEYKVMGLSAYGEPEYYDAFKKVVDVKDDGSYKLDMSYFTYHYKTRMPSRKFLKEFGPVREGEEINKRHKNIAASLQKVSEEVIFKVLNQAYKETKQKNLCMAGGVSLNSVANGKILKKTPFKDLYILPAAGDGGTSVGAAFYSYNTLFGNKREYVLDSAFLGPGFSDKEVKSYLDENEIVYSSFKDNKDMIEKTADLLYGDNIVGWFQGRMEFGPRALGSRSILANPSNTDMQNILNLKVKHREKFRPFAPVVPREDAKKYFETDPEIPLPTDFMLLVYPIKKEYHAKLPAITHVDGSGRLQTITKSANPDYYSLIKEFEKRSGFPILINTSFNIRGEPIVCTPEDAYRCVMGTGIDYLVMNNFLISRKDNKKDEWDSEKYAID